MAYSDRLRNLKVGVIGGSIAGCATAAELLRLGCDVTVLERSQGKLEDRGAGLALAPSLIETLKDHGLFDAGMAYIPNTQRPYIVRAAEDAYLGRTIWDQPAAMWGTNWDVLYGQLRKRVPDDRYLQGCDATGLEETNDGIVRVTLADGTMHIFDLVICADGYDSIGRRALYPDREIEYAGYILWRGLMPEMTVPDIEPFERGMVMGVYAFGHGFFYIVPGRSGGLATGERRLNWGIYQVVTDEEAANLLTDVNGVTHRTSVPPGAVSEGQIDYAHRLAKDHFPNFIADAVCATPDPFVQAIYDAEIPAYHKGRICVIGDASTLVRPHAGSGSVKAMTDAMALAEALARFESVEAALDAWDAVQAGVGNQLVALSRSLGSAMVTDVPDWSTMDAADMKTWFDKAVGGRSWYAVDEAAGR